MKKQAQISSKCLSISLSVKKHREPLHNKTMFGGACSNILHSLSKYKINKRIEGKKYFFYYSTMSR